MNRYIIDAKDNGYLLTVKNYKRDSFIASLVFAELTELFEEIASREPVIEGSE